MRQKREKEGQSLKGDLSHPPKKQDARELTVKPQLRGNM